MGLTVTTSESTLPPGEPLELAGLLAFADHGIASRVLAKSSGGNVTLFTFEQGQGLTEHISPFDALVFILEGTMALTIGNRLARASAGTVTRMPASIPHALQAEETHPYAPRDAS
jgi:quercetin dioxygenase-like cupin family protein